MKLKNFFFLNLFEEFVVLVRINLWYNLDILILNFYLNIKISNVNFLIGFINLFKFVYFFFYLVMRVILFLCFNCEVGEKFLVFGKDKKGLVRVDLLEKLLKKFLIFLFLVRVFLF